MSISKHLIIGPLPPPMGGATVSFRLFLDELKKRPHISFRHLDLTLRIADRPKRYLIKWGFRFLYALFCIPFHHTIIIFGSKRFNFSFGLLLILIARLFNKPCHIRFFGGKPMLALSPLPKFLQKMCLSGMQQATTIIPETDHGSKEFPDTFQKYKNIIVPGYRPPCKILKNQYFISNKRKIVYTGGINPEKGIETLIKGFKLFQSQTSLETELHIFGNGNLDVQNDPTICFHGSVENCRLRKKLIEYDIFIFPSHYDNEGHPGAIIEALFAGLPVIAYDSPVIREVVTDCVEGLLFSPLTPQKLAEAIYQLLSNDTQRQNMSSAALQKSAFFSTELQISRLIEIFQLN